MAALVEVHDEAELDARSPRAPNHRRQQSQPAHIRSHARNVAAAGRANSCGSGQGRGERNPRCRPTSRGCGGGVSRVPGRRAPHEVGRSASFAARRSSNDGQDLRHHEPGGRPVAVEAGAAAHRHRLLLASSPRYVTPGAGLEICHRGAAQRAESRRIRQRDAARDRPHCRERRPGCGAAHGQETAVAAAEDGPGLEGISHQSGGWSPAAMEGFNAEAFLLDSAVQGTHIRLEARSATSAAASSSPADSTPRTSRRRFGRVRPWGVDACSRLELAPGKKDHAKVRQFVKAALKETS